MKNQIEEEISTGVCGYTNKQGMNINTCKDKPLITYCKKCNSLYAVNQDDGTRTEVCFTFKKIL